MSSGSLKDLTKTLTTALPSLSLPLPSDILQVVHAYLEKHEAHDESDSQRLQDELLTIYQNQVVDNPSRIAPFLSILRILKPNIRGSGRLLQWWEKLAESIMQNLGEQKGLAGETRDTLLEILAADEEDEDEDAIATSASLANNLMAAWLKNDSVAMHDFDEKARFVEGQIKIILMAFGKKRPKAFLTTIDKYFVRKDSRIATLRLLYEFIRHQPPHLHQMLQTPLFANILRCLQIDTSTRAISLAMTTLVMFLPHIPVSCAAHLPALFNIYSRMLFWDRERRAAASETSLQSLGNDLQENPQQTADQNGSWQKLSYLLESDDDTVPELLHYFTFLYGLYPINFMSYIRKPQKYLRHANFPGAEDLDVEPTEIRERSETFREVHLLHPNFFTMTIESELTDNNRWMKSDPADVVAECMALYSAGEDNVLHASRSKHAFSHKKIETNADIPEEPLLDDVKDASTYKHTSWRTTQSTAVASPEPSRNSHGPGLYRKSSQTSQSLASIADSPPLSASDRLDSPTIPPQLMSSEPALKDMLTSQASTRGSIYRSATNDSVHSFANTHDPDNSYHIDADLESLARGPVGPSPALRPTTLAEPSTRIAYLHREIQLLHNDLNFERYLKQQHLSHIGQLRRKQIREARVEAETQNLINSNKALKSRLEENKKNMLQLKRETEKSKAHSRKWEADLSSKLRILREEQKKWLLEREELITRLGNLEHDSGSLRNMVVAAESRELSSQQKMQSIGSNLNELEYLKGEIEKLTLALRKYEANELQATLDKEKEEALAKEVELLKMKLRARDEEALKVEATKRDMARVERPSAQDVRNTLPQEVLESALSVSRKRIVEIQKAHNHLLNRYNALQETYTDLKEMYDQKSNKDEVAPLLGGSRSPRTENIDIFAHDGRSPTSYFGPALSAGRVKPVMVHSSDFPRPELEQRSMSVGNAAHSAATYHYGHNRDRSSGDSIDYALDHDGKSKAISTPAKFYHGRGGFQNLRKDKDKKDKGKGKEKSDIEATEAAAALSKKKRGVLGFGDTARHVSGYM